MMDRLGALNAFMRTAETNSFVAAGRNLGVSAVGKAISRLEQRLGARLFQRSTRSMRLTAEGVVFLDHCRRIFEEVDAAEAALAQTNVALHGILRVSLPIAGMLLMPVLSAIMRAYPAIRMDIDFSDRLVDMIEEGFDAVIRTGAIPDTNLMSRGLGGFRHRLVASPDYLARRGVPSAPEDLAAHECLHHRYSNSGRLEPWPLMRDAVELSIDLPKTAITSTIEPLVYLAVEGFGIACLPPFAVSDQIRQGSLVSILENNVRERGAFYVLWPARRYLASKTRVFVDFLAQHLVLQ